MDNVKALRLILILLSCILPVFGNKVREMGYDLPKPAGVMLGYFFQQQDLLIQNLAVGFQDMEELIDIAELKV